jgi:hypothetical protein
VVEAAYPRDPSTRQAVEGRVDDAAGRAARAAATRASIWLGEEAGGVFVGREKLAYDVLSTDKKKKVCVCVRVAAGRTHTPRPTAGPTHQSIFRLSPSRAEPA